MATSFLPVQKGRLNFSGAPPKNPYLPRIMLLDMNSFFASVEQQANPALRGRPVGVVASMHPTSCLIAASKEAKARGIRTGTLIKYAKRICPDLVLMPSEPEKYRAVHQGFNRIIAEYTGQVERYSIDETFIDLRGTRHNPLVVGAEIKRRIKDEVGEWLTCSVGIGENKFLAKLAAELKKPDGLSVIWREQLREVYRGKKLSDLWGISRGWTARLARLNITAPDQLLDYPVQNLISVFGKPGFYIWQRVNGLEEDAVESEDAAAKSFGHSWVLNFRTTDKARLGKVILRLAEKAARRMRREGQVAYGVYLGLRLADRSGWYKTKKLKTPISSGLELYEQAQILWRDWKIPSNVSWIGTGFVNLNFYHKQLPLFGGREQGLLDAIDAINDKYGEFTIRPGSLANTHDYAPDAIAFGL